MLGYAASSWPYVFLRRFRSSRRYGLVAETNSLGLFDGEFVKLCWRWCWIPISDVHVLRYDTPRHFYCTVQLKIISCSVFIICKVVVLTSALSNCFKSIPLHISFSSGESWGSIFVDSPKYIENSKLHSCPALSPQHDSNYSNQISHPYKSPAPRQQTRHS